MRKLQLSGDCSGTLVDVFNALCRTLAFRRWPREPEDAGSGLPPAGAGYRCHAGAVHRTGRVVEIMRPIGLTLQEVLDDPPCRVSLIMRWRVDPTAQGCRIRLSARYRLNRAATLRAGHWRRRLAAHFRRQLKFLDANLERARREKT
jgi:hypothetical protein